MLKITNLSHSFNGEKLFSLETLDIPDGGHLLILGRSGSGKSTLLNILGGLLQPKTGIVEIDNRDIYSLSRNMRDRLRGKKIGFIFQKLHLIPTLNVIENLLLANFMVGEKQNRPHALKMLESLEIKNKKHALPENLSVGEMQRVAIARACMNHPKIILADEPTSALDDASCNKVIELLLGRAKELNSSLVVATHDHRIQQFFSHKISLA